MLTVFERRASKRGHPSPRCHHRVVWPWSPVLSAIDAAAPVLMRAAASGEKSLVPTRKAPMEPRTSEQVHQSPQRALSGGAALHAGVIKKKTHGKIFHKMLFKRTKYIYSSYPQ